MEPLCDFCGVVRAVVYCRSDLARLCLHCDSCVHSANSLSRKHPRSLLCDMCNSQSAVARCLDDKMSVCQSCDLNGNGCSSLGHSLQALDSYSGCPSLAEFSRIWASVLYSSSSSSSGFDNNGWGSLTYFPVNDNCMSSCLEQRDHNEGSFGLVAAKMSEFESCTNIDSWLDSSSMIPLDPRYVPNFRNQPAFLPEELHVTKDYSKFRDLKLHDGDALCQSLNMGDVQLNFKAGDEIFGCQQGHKRYQIEDLETDCLLNGKNLSVTESNGHIESALEASSSGQQDCAAFQSSRVGRSANVMQAMNSSGCMVMNPCSNRSINLGFPAGQVHSGISISVSNITGESSAADYQDCGLSPVFLNSESPWESNLEVSCPQARDKAKMRYNEKKKTRTFGKQIRYASRKARADTRKRVKGRFVKAGEAYDYDPLVTRDF